MRLRRFWRQAFHLSSLCAERQGQGADVVALSTDWRCRMFLGGCFWGVALWGVALGVSRIADLMGFENGGPEEGRTREGRWCG